MKKRLIVLLGCFLLLGGCQFLPHQEAEQGIKEEPVVLDWYINYSWFDTEWGLDVVSQAITEKTGVHINFVTPKGTESNTLHTLLMGNEMPDIVTMGWWEPQVEEMITSDRVYAFDELEAKYHKGFYEVADEEFVKWNTKEDGYIYAYPNSALTPSDYKANNNIASNQTFLVRKDIYEAIGQPDMTTPEGFMQAIRDAVAMYPEIAGQPIIPIGAHQFDTVGNVSFDKYLQNFLAVPYEKDNRYYDRYTDPDYIAWLKVFRQLGEEGYLADEIFTDQRVQMEEKQAAGRYFCMIYQRTDLRGQQITRYNEDPESIYIAIDGPKNSKQEDHTLPGTGITGWTMTMISKDTKYPDKALELITYMISEEGQLLTTVGVEGKTFDWIDGKAVLKDEVVDVLYTDRATCDQLYGIDNTYWMLQDESVFLKWQPPMQEPLKQMQEWTIPYTQYLDQYVVSFAEDGTLHMIDEQIKELWGETIIDLLLAETEESFDATLEAFIAQREALGFEQLMEASTLQMQKTKERLTQLE